MHAAGRSIFSCSAFDCRRSRSGGTGAARLQPWHHGSVLGVEMRKIGNEILDDGQMRERVDPHVPVDVRAWLRAGERVDAIDIHRTGAADALPAGAPERERRVNLALDPDQDIKNHGTAGIYVHFIRVDARRAIGIRIEAINLEATYVRHMAQRHDATCRFGP